MGLCGFLFLFLFLALICYFVYFQVYKSESFINSPYNSLQDLFSERVVRGDILSADGQTLATTKVDSAGNEQLSMERYETMLTAIKAFYVNGLLEFEIK